METKETNKSVHIKVDVEIKPENCKIIKQQEIKHKTDKIYAGIYETDIFKNIVYIICCNREIGCIEGNKIYATLDYTRFAATEAHANKMYDMMIAEIKLDLER